jgi:hypothetical protein
MAVPLTCTSAATAAAAASARTLALRTRCAWALRPGWLLRCPTWWRRESSSPRSERHTQTACVRAAATDAAVQSSRLRSCSCVAGYSGPYQGTCTWCIATAESLASKRGNVCTEALEAAYPGNCLPIWCAHIAVAVHPAYQAAVLPVSLCILPAFAYSGPERGQQSNASSMA